MSVGAADAPLDGLKFREPEIPTAVDSDDIPFEQSVGDVDDLARDYAELHRGAQPTLAVTDEHMLAFRSVHHSGQGYPDDITHDMGLGEAKSDELRCLVGEQDTLPLLELGSLRRRAGGVARRFGLVAGGQNAGGENQEEAPHRVETGLKVVPLSSRRRKPASTACSWSNRAESTASR